MNNSTETKILRVILGILIVANTFLDYNAICEFSQVEPFKFEQFGFGNIGALFVAVGVAGGLFAFPKFAAKFIAEDKKPICVGIMAFCVVSSIVVAFFRIFFEVGNVGYSISGGFMSTLTPDKILFAVILLIMLLSETFVALFYALSNLKDEVVKLQAAIIRIADDIANIPEQKLSAAKVVNARINETMCAVNAANELVYENVLSRAGEFQNSFVGYVSEGRRAREEHEQELKERLDELMIPIPDGDPDLDLDEASATSEERSDDNIHRQSAAKTTAVAA